MNIVLHIERLVLDGVPLAAADHEALKATLAGELSRLLIGGLRSDLQTGGAQSSVAGGSIELARGVGAAQLGQQLAQAVHAGIGASQTPSGGTGAATP
jgi:hypothetical protein